MNKENMYLKPINLIIEEIKKSPTNGVFLVGAAGSGKTYTLLEYVEKSKKTNKPVIDITLISNYSMEISNDFTKLFQICIILQKMLLYIKENYLKCYVEHFLLFNTKTINILNEIIIMYNLNNYQLNNNLIDNNVLNRPEILLEEFLDISLKYLKYDNLTVVLDNFDIEKPYMYLYQTYMYNMLKKYLYVVATISDLNVINNPNKLNKLSKNNTLVEVNYNKDVKIVKKILDKSLMISQNKNVISKKVSFIFNDNAIKELIIKTNGNLSLMIFVMKTFFECIKDIYLLDYDKYLLSIVDEYLNSSNQIFDKHSKQRKLLL